MIKFCIIAVTFISLALGAQAADKEKGKRVYNICKACHALKAGKNKIGPTLHGIMGRKAGTVAKFKYSNAMKNSGLTWDEETLRKYLTKPRKFLKGTRMSFGGIKRDNDMDNLIAFLKIATK